MATNLLQSPAEMALLDVLLVDVAHKVQLSPTDYGLAVDRYSTIEDWLRRDGSPLSEFLERLYPQGSMAIGATIASRLQNDEFDVDVVAELNIRADSAPALVLDKLFEAVNGEPGSRYHGKVARRTRCVTIEYDKMHIDVTPSVLLPDREARTSLIFHAHEDQPATEHRSIVANPWGFAQWFIAQTPHSREIVEAFVRKSSDPVPNQDDIRDKSTPLLALQLLKRWRNKCYDSREGRCPPSIVLAYYVAMNRSQNVGLFAELLHQARALRAEVSRLHTQGHLLNVVNPRCPTDIFTDRWPEDVATQGVFKADLDNLVAKLEYLAAKPTIERCDEVFKELFGEAVTKTVIKEFAERFSRNAADGAIRQDGFGISTGALAAKPKPASISGTQIKRHTDYGT